MEDIFNTAKHLNESVNIENFKMFFDECFEREIIKKRVGKDSYFVVDSIENEAVRKLYLD